jgi:hypothetical protein
MESEKTVLAGYRTDELMAYAFGQLIYDVEDDDAGQRSGLRGHSLARDMYGYYYSYTGSPPELTPGDNDRPFRGTGRMDAEKNYINFTTFNKAGAANIRDPERYGAPRTSNTASNPYFGGFNPPYTFPDLNHVFLAKTDSSGNIIEPSFYRSITGGPTLNPLDNYWKSDPAAASGDEKMSIRPRPANHSQLPNSKFPAPASDKGDVRNLPWGTQNDSVWIDLGVPPKTAANGKRYKPLFAFLVQDLDGRANVNAHGNVHGRDANGTYAQTHTSGQGWGAWEVSLERVLGAPGKQIVLNRQSGLATANPLFDIPSGGSLSHTYSPVNYNASADQAMGNNGPIYMPGAALAFSPFGFADDKAYGQGQSFERSTSNAGGPIVHGATWNPNYDSTLPFGAPASPTDLRNKPFKPENLGWNMGRFTRNPTKYNDSAFNSLGIFASLPFVSNRDSKFDKITTMSWDLDRRGLIPYFVDSSTQLTSPPIDPSSYNGIIASRPANTAVPNFSSNLPSMPPPPYTAAAEIKTDDRDSLGRLKNSLASIQRLYLNRPLTKYPPINPATGKYPAMSDTSSITNERNAFAKEIFDSLVAATGALSPSDPNAGTIFTNNPPSDPKYFATKTLAQLAANIVDNLDVDDVMTMFQWNSPTDVVYGTELGRLVINEVYTQLENDPTDINPAMMGTPPKKYNVNIYAELYNPTPSDTVGVDGLTNFNNDYAPFTDSYSLRLLPSGTGNGKYDPFAPDQSQSSLDGITDLTTNRVVLPAANKIPSGSFMVFGPKPDGMSSGISDPKWDPAMPNSFLKDTPIQFTVTADKLWDSPDNIISKYENVAPNKKPVLVLQRLMDPHQPSGPSNQYVVVDFIHITPEMIAKCDARKWIIDTADPTKSKDYSMTQIAMEKRRSFCRPQPFAYLPPVIGPVRDGADDNVGTAAVYFPSYKKEYGSLVASFNDPAMPLTAEPQTTFGKVNAKQSQLDAVNASPPTLFFPRASGANFAGGDFTPQDTLETPFPRIHLDRIVSSPTELMTTSLYRPHEFHMLNNKDFSYCAPWFDTNSRLYRWLEFVQAGDVRYLQNTADNSIYPVTPAGGRVPGKINLNTVSKDVFLALCDAQSGNRFNESQLVKTNPLDPNEANKLYETLVSMRPFWGNGVGNATGNDALSLSRRGRNQTLLAQHDYSMSPDPDTSDLFKLIMDPLNSEYNNKIPTLTANGLPPGMGNSRQQEFHPSVRLELLNKIFGRTTSRSNCFAVWLTVGYFEVTSENGGVGQPAHVLGKELEPKLRKRFFAMIDRTHLQKWSVDVGPLAANTPYPVSSISGGNPLNTYTNKTYTINPGSVITIDPNTPYEETVEVDASSNFTLKYNHSGGTSGKVTIISRGNPGPMSSLGLGYRIEKDTNVVPYFAVLE